MTTALAAKMALGSNPDLRRTVAVYVAVAKKAGVEAKWSKPTEPYTNSKITSARRELRELLVTTVYGLKDLNRLHDDLIATTHPIPATHNGLKGSIYDAWVKHHHGGIATPPGFYIDQDKYTVKADGWLLGKTEIAEVKAVTKPPGRREIAQMGHYVTICSSHKYFCAVDEDQFDIDRVVYSFSSQEGLDHWAPVLAVELSEIRYRTVVGLP